MSGPPPDPRSLKQAKVAEKGGWTTLPAEGRGGEPPEWPLAAAGARELELWADLWAKPQAVMWERMSQEHEVALCVRAIVRTELGADVRAADFTVVRQYMDSLGLSVQGMLRNRWKVTQGAEEQASEEPPAERPRRRSSARDRLKVVSSGEGA